MYKTKSLIALAISATLASGCSTKPRQFAPALTAPAERSAHLEQDVRVCDTLVKQGRTSDFASAAATMATTGVATVGSGVAMVGTGMVGWTSSGTGAAAAGFAMPVIGIFAGFGISRAIRGGKERKYKARMDTCLTELGYTTDGWQKIAKRGDPGLEASRLAKFEATAPLVEIPQEPAGEIIPAVIVDATQPEVTPEVVSEDNGAEIATVGALANPILPQ
ncbi:MAG: hypothetical protein EP350_03635 [Alphaproteobacteria bacterium]|nr:MAG: hypothetical protein EP350_03635 [Alphaproteobacteria bacterium]